MRECKKCGVFIHGNSTVCPLCQGKVEGENDDPDYPKIDTVYNQHRVFFKLLILITVSCSIICAAVNMILPQSGIWSLFVALGVACFWFSLATAFRNRNNMSRNIVHQVILISLMCVLWDYITGWKGWSVDYVFPISCIVAMLSIEILSIVLKIKNRNYKVYMALNIVLGLTPLVLYFAKLITVSIPSIICAAVSTIFFVFALLFYGDEIRKELQKRFHL